MALLPFEDLLEAAKRGDWGFVDYCLEYSHLTPERVAWAIREGVSDSDVDVRELAATVLEDSDAKIVFTDDESALLLRRMREEDCDLVRYRIAIALYRRKNCDPLVIEAMHEAALNRYIYKEARALLDAK